MTCSTCPVSALLAFVHTCVHVFLNVCFILCALESLDDLHHLNTEDCNGKDSPYCALTVSEFPHLHYQMMMMMMMMMIY